MSTPTTLIGTTLGSYQIQSLLGSGGMATVYRGFDQQLHRPVAVKVLAPALASDPAYVERFRQEARLIANLRHPHIAQVYAFGEHDGAPYMVQELLPGPTLEQRLKELAAQGIPMPQREVLETVAQLAGALDAAHAVGVIHRDVKPGNALYNAQRQIVLTDFGIARNTADPSRTATAAGVIMGTPAYIAPEQATGSATLTPACDVYALGVVLFELLAGRLPFEAGTAMGVVLKHLYDPPPAPSSLRPGLPAALDAVVLRALAKEPAARFPSAGAFAQALAAAWPAAGAAAPAPAADIHNQATSVWVRPASAQAAQPNQNTPSTNTTSRIAVAPPPPAQQPAALPAASAGERSRLLLPLALVLAAVLGIGAFLATRSSDDQIAGTPAQTVATPVVSVPTTVAPESSPVPPGAAVLPAEPLPVPVEASPPAAEPPPNNDVPPTPVNPLDGLNMLLSDGATWAEQGSKESQELTRRLGELSNALERRDAKRGSELVREMQNRIAELAREGKMEGRRARLAQSYLAQIASSLSTSGDQGEDGKDDKGKDDKGKGKGN